MLKGAALIGGRCLKEGGAYFKERGIIQMKLENFVTFFLKKKNDYRNKK